MLPVPDHQVTCSGTGLLCISPLMLTERHNITEGEPYDSNNER